MASFWPSRHANITTKVQLLKLIRCKKAFQHVQRGAANYATETSLKYTIWITPRYHRGLGSRSPRLIKLHQEDISEVYHEASLRHHRDLANYVTKTGLIAPLTSFQNHHWRSPNCATETFQLLRVSFSTTPPIIFSYIDLPNCSKEIVQRQHCGWAS